jgi:hypothetical protein
MLICTWRPGVPRTQVVGDEGRQLRQVDRLACQRLRRQAGQRQHGVDHLVHARAGGQHAVEVVVAHAVEVPAVVLLDDAREAFDDADGRAQVVRDGVDQRRRVGSRTVIGAQGQATAAGFVAQQPPAAAGCRIGQPGAQGRWRSRFHVGPGSAADFGPDAQLKQGGGIGLRQQPLAAGPGGLDQIEWSRVPGKLA